MLQSLPPDAHFHPFGQGVHHGGADAMQTAGDLVGILVEFAARMKLGQNDFRRADPLFLMHVGRDASSVIPHGHAAIGVQDQFAVCGEPRLRLVNGVINDFKGHMVQTGPVIRITDIHARTFAYCVQSLEHRNGGRAVVVVFGGRNRTGSFGHNGMSTPVVRIGCSGGCL